MRLSREQKVTGFLPKDDGMKNAFTGADVVVIPAGIPRKLCSTLMEAQQLTMLRQAGHDP